MTMKLTSKGQVTIPRKLREHDGLLPETEVSFEMAEGGVLIRPTAAARVQRLREAIAGSRGRADKGLRTADWMRLTR
jgi:antitoxin PrlF